LKTGYINASGYNLAASATRNGRRIFGIVLGGRSPSLRDGQMWSLLDQGFGATTPAGSSNRLLLASAATMPSLKPDGSEGDGGADDSAEDGTSSPTTSAMQSALPPAPPPVLAPSAPALVTPTAPSTAPSAAPAAAVVELQLPTMQAPAAQAATTTRSKTARANVKSAPVLKPGTTTAATGNRLWAIQVGAFSRYSTARQTALKARAKLPASMPATRLAIDESRVRKTKLYRARLVGFAPSEANSACRVLKARGFTCVVVSSGNVTIAEVPAQ
jgi:D-alanyl-D-alanine carboxypeptidase